MRPRVGGRVGEGWGRGGAHHEAVGEGEDLVDIAQGSRLLDLRDDEGALGHGGAHLVRGRGSHGEDSWGDEGGGGGIGGAPTLYMMPMRHMHGVCMACTWTW